MRRSTPGIALALVALVLLPSAPLTAQEARTAYAVQGGDQLTITFFTSAGEEISEIAGERTVGLDGNIFLPFLGIVRVAGMDAPTIRELLVERYAPFFENPVIDVEARLRVSVTGAVGRPGNFFVDPTTSLVDLLAQAGGISEFVATSDRVVADASQVRLVRDGTTEIIDFRADSLDRDRALSPIESGDWLYVPFSRRSRVREQVSFWGQIVTVIVSIAIFFNVT